MIQSVWKNLTGLQKAAEHLWCDFKWATNSSPNTNDLYIWVVILDSYKTGATEIFILNTLCFHLYCQFGSPFSLLKKGVSQYFSPYTVYKSLVFGDEFLAHLKSHQRCSAGIRPVKFFYTDWIIISLWFLSYTQRHCHVRIEKSSVQTVAIKLDSLEYHYILKQ